MTFISLPVQICPSEHMIEITDIRESNLHLDLVTWVGTLTVLNTIIVWISFKIMSIQEDILKGDVHSDINIRQGDSPPEPKSENNMDAGAIVYESDLSVQQVKKVHGLTVLTAVVFIVGEIAGTGVLTLPYAVEGAGWIGFVLIAMCCLISAYTGHMLGEAWCLVRARYEEYKGQARYPYPAIGEVTYGKPGRYMVSFSINFTMFGGAVVFLLLASQNIQSLLEDVHEDMSFCYWLMIVSGVLIPLSWLGTPKDFWPIAIAASTATSIACVVLFANMMVDSPTIKKVHHSSPGFLSFFSSFGTICFAFGGHPAFPTFHADMRDERKFGKAVLLAYTVVLAMYVPVSTTGYFVYGDLLKDNVLQTVSSGPMAYIVEFVITLHLICAYIIVLNPVSQEVEEILKVPKEFSWKRCVVRTGMVALVLFVAESVPHFGAILSLIGGSTLTLLAYVFPPLFYLKLCRMEGPWKKIHVPLHVKVANYEIVFVGLIAGVAATYSAIASLAQPGAFTVPCYVNVTAAMGK